MSLDIDVSVLFDQINTWFPVFFPIVAIGAGISIAIALAVFLANIIKKSIGGGR